MPSTSIESESLIVCRDCGLPKAKGEFRRRFRDRPVLIQQCSRCHTTEETRRAFKKRQLRNDRRLGAMTRGIALADHHDRVRVLAGKLLKEFGGVAGVARRLSNCVQRHPNSKSTGYVFLATMKMSLVETELPDPETSTGDRRQQLARAMVLWILEHESIAVECLRELGFTVLAPLEANHSELESGFSLAADD